MKKFKVFILTGLLALCLVGCQKKAESAAGTAAAAETTTAVETTTAAETTVAVETTTAAEAETTAEIVKKGPPMAAQSSEYEIKEGVLKLTLPESWRDSYYYNVFNSKSSTSIMVAFYESKDYNANGTGWLCSVLQLEGNDPASYKDLESYTYLGEVISPNGLNYAIVVEYPTDVQYTQQTMELYSIMWQDINTLVASMMFIDGAQFIPNPEIYGYNQQANNSYSYDDDWYYSDDNDYDADYGYDYGQGMAGDYALQGWQTADMRDGVEEGFLCLIEDGSGVLYLESMGGEIDISWYDAGDDIVAMRIGDDRYEGYYYPELEQIRVRIGDKVYYFGPVNE